MTMSISTVLSYALGMVVGGGVVGDGISDGRNIGNICSSDATATV
jgi:hypothetical protein